MSPLSTEKQSRKEDAKNSDDQSQLNESTEQMVKGEEVRVVPPAGGHRRRRPQTMRKHTNARQRNRRISSSDDESSKDDKNEESVESTQSISVSHSKKSAPVKTNTKECNANAVRDRKTPSETKNEHKEVFSEYGFLCCFLSYNAFYTFHRTDNVIFLTISNLRVVPSTSSNHRTASTRADVKQQKRSKTNGADRESFKIPSISKAKSTVPSSHKKTVPKSAGNMTDEKHVQKKLTSCGVQAFLEDIEQHPSTSLVPVSSQTSDSELIEYLMDKWNNEESATLCKEIDSNQMKRRLKMARFVIESQRNEIKKLSDKYCKLEELFCCAKSAFDELK
ncbi:unnamed protein product [Anisakis simplex]|uniref:Uncharacterized protein n=1 Tax=Anisakis simplex TaxID=6269 RepID=A0A3P6NTD4_ANISI|nr:unnamed protein product [Anisakis simplex]